MMGDVPNSLLRLRGLPYEATQADVLSFFDGFETVALHFIERSGKPTGEAYVEFSSPGQAERALRIKQREYLGARYIEIFDAVEARLVMEATAPHAQPSLKGHVVRLRGLPFSSSTENVLKFLAPAKAAAGSRSVLFTCGNTDGHPTGEAFVEFASESDMEAALKMNNERLGSRYVEVFPSSKGKLFQAVNHRGFFTAKGSTRVYHPPLPPDASGADSSSTPASRTSSSGDRTNGGARAADAVNAAMQSMAAMGLSHRDRQVPGPPRRGGYPSSVPNGYVSIRNPPPHFPAAGRGFLPLLDSLPQTRWVPVVQPPMVMPASQHGRRFEPAPGPPGGAQFEYRTQPMVAGPQYVVQQVHPHPLMQQQTASVWGAPGAYMSAGHGSQQQPIVWYTSGHPMVGGGLLQGGHMGYYNSQQVQRGIPSQHSGIGYARYPHQQGQQNRSRGHSRGHSRSSSSAVGDSSVPRSSPGSSSSL